MTDWAFTATTATFEFDGVAAGSVSTLSHSFGRVFFTVDVNTAYSISGSYSFSDRWEWPTLRGGAYLRTLLFDNTTAQTVFSSAQTGFGVDESGTYYLGGMSDSYSLFGSPSGSLVAGHQYYWETFAEVSGNPGTVSGSGSVTLSIGTAVVPLPPSALMGLTLLSGLGLAKLLRRRKESALA